MTRVFNDMHRRAFLRSAALAGAGAMLPWRAAAQGAAVTATDDRSAVFSGFGENVFATRAEGGLILVDTGAQDRSEALMAALKDHFGDVPVIGAFNTHWHYPNTGGNAAVTAQGAPIFAHENTRLWLSGDFLVPWEERRYTPQPEAMLPTDTFHATNPETLHQTLGGREVEYVHAPRAHTDGDIFVHFRDADVIAAGGLVAVGHYPILDYATGGWIGKMTDAAEMILQAAGPDTKIVPGAGPVVGRDHVQAQFEMLKTVRDRVYDMLRAGKDAQEMLGARVTEEFDAQWGDPSLFISNAYPGLHGHTYEVGGIY